jgi:hypothetical protein
MTVFKFNSIFFRVINVCVLLTTIGCSTTTKEKIIRNTLIAGAIGYAIGQQRPENQTAYGSMYAGNMAAAAAIGSLYYYDIDKESEDLKKENQFLKSQLDQFQKPTLIEQGNSLFKSQIPGPLSKLVRLGEWKHYKLDQWIQDQSNPNLWFRQIESFEIIPPSSN